MFSVYEYVMGEKGVGMMHFWRTLLSFERLLSVRCTHALCALRAGTAEAVVLYATVRHAEDDGAPVRR